MTKRKVTMKEAQEHYDNLTPETVNRSKRRARQDPDDYDYEDDSYYRSRAFSRMMDAYENRMDWKYER
jgi:hypothetical protein